ncbi:hypothetical protein M2459_000630 [Parabacteroides sp. PF5-5]|uniref:LytTR family DNA-binding domain-containing protein n=1 Tax=unclassified Parabacteroides TaxID=2649774 RepID=UPI0024767A0E|nr:MULTISPECIES: LytTR family DNA-binding domain-containing protein [unclassified Parabacteroides]MDH6303436.1 hypothetical protein [Parabacteroides sp. PH5-39]MDH6314759.1 hypothetical protein [Parabacteroides sp. PF5-13]MDH6318096.1 hypothetical protein [Parabacteroides sp. PH5-13]MDH6321973.1 hypothetical protein [Parabacteroides sp. PH5-8]MDH6326096.1 hypothetical protein [Parabacteroides sp. PH5-41]
MNKLTRLLNQPLPLVNNRWQVVLIASLLVFFVLGIFQPFGMDRLLEKNYIYLLGFTLVTAIGTSIIVYLFPLIFKRFYSDNWTIGKSILNMFIIVLVIGLGNTIYFLLVVDSSISFTWGNILRMGLLYLMFTFFVALIPQTIITFIQYNRSLSQNLQEVQELNQKLSGKIIPQQKTYTSELITLSGNTKDSIELHPEQLIYLEAFGNYVKVNYIENETVKQKLLRATIKQIENQLSATPFIIRCHRAFLVNTNHISSVKGNSQGYRLLFDYPTEEVPVSRAYAKEIREKI